MKTEKANRLNSILEISIAIFWKIFQQANKLSLSKEYVSENILQFQQTDFDQYYQEFIDELNENIEEYRDIELIENYIDCNLKEVPYHIQFEDNLNKRIIKNNFKVNFLLNARKTLEFNRDRIMKILNSDIDNLYSNELKRIFSEKMKQLDPDFELENTMIYITEDIDNLAIDNRFCFIVLKKEIESLELTHQKIKLIKDRLLDFYQWQFIYDNIDSKDILMNGFYSDLYYPNFVQLCELELKRYEFDTEDSQKINIAPFQHVKSDFSWSASDTDLLELVTALFLENALKHRDGTSFTRKELTSCFQELFGMEIKDVEVKLTRATNRKMSTTPFLDKLKLAFENYVQEKEEKQLKRK